MSAASGSLPALAVGGERRLLTILFCDLVDSSQLAGRLDPEDLREVLTVYQRRATEIIEASGGMVARYQGEWDPRLLRLPGRQRGRRRARRDRGF
jgi:class 3 adenylate cyclase